MITNSFTSIIKKTVLAAFFLLSGMAAAQNADEQGRFQIADEPTTPRLSAMGGAGTAIAGGGFAIYNAASPAFAPQPFISVEYGGLPTGVTDGTGDLTRSKIESAWMFSHWFAGASLSTWSTDFLPATEQGVSPLSSSWQVMQATFTGGFKVGRFAMGNCFDFYQDRLGDIVNDRAITYSPGFLFQLVPGKVTLGGSLRNYVRLDTSLAKLGWFGAIGLPRYVRAGAAWTDTLKKESIPLTVAMDVVYSDVYKRLMVPVGVEAWVLPCLAARLGVPINHPSDLFHFGVGVRINNITCDFDYGLTQPVGISDASYEQKWLLGLSYALSMPHPDAAVKKGAAPPSSPGSAAPEGASDSSITVVPGLPR